MKLHSPDGSAVIDAHPSKVESLLAKGWTEEEKKKSRSKAKAEAKVEDVVEPVEESDKESE
jgi:hypothetical protein